MTSRTPEYSVIHGDALTATVDVLALKHAQMFYGVDRLMADLLARAGTPYEQLSVAPGQHRRIETKSPVVPPVVLYMGTAPLASFGYGEIRQFARDVLRVLAHSDPWVKSIGMTLHGPGYGLDEVESALAQLGGCLDALRHGELPPALEDIRVIEIDPARFERVTDALASAFAGQTAVRSARGDRWSWSLEPFLESRRASADTATTRLRNGDAGLIAKPHAFVAMPFAREMEDVFHYGILGPVRAHGFICERIDQEAFTGDIVARVKQRIETAAVVIADLTGANPNVYLEVGYAWGTGRPCILLLGGSEEPRFDVRGARHIRYSTIKELEGLLDREMAALRVKGVVA